MSDQPLEQWKPYKWLWKRIGGRPWTWIMRDSQKANPLMWLLGMAFLVCWIIWILDRKPRLACLVAFFIGLILAHLFW
ncbi:MAG: hypothetical protein WC057_07260 [Dehalococcoidales bacterium]